MRKNPVNARCKTCEKIPIHVPDCHLCDNPLALSRHSRAYDTREVDEREVRAVRRLDLDGDKVAAEPVLLALAHLDGEKRQIMMLFLLFLSGRQKPL